MLTKRQKKLLHALVQEYIQTATPVSSEHLVRSCRLEYSPATVRNEMMELEERGLVVQPHTSAGRIPTDRAYRFYVDSLMKKECWNCEEGKSLQECISQAKGNLRQLLEEISKTLSEISKELAVVITPRMIKDVFDRMELIPLTENKILVVVHLFGKKEKRVFLQTSGESFKDLHRLASLVAERLSGLTLGEIRESIKTRFEGISTFSYPLLRKIIDSAHELFDFSGPVEIITHGTPLILDHPEFGKKQVLQEFFSFVEDKQRLFHVFMQQSKPYDVRIGSENKDDRLKPFSIVTANYQIGQEDGILGIIGPIRMRYSKILPLVAHTAEVMTHYLS